MTVNSFVGALCNRLLSVQQSDGLGKETIAEPGCPSFDVVEPLFRGQQGEQSTMGGGWSH